MIKKYIYSSPHPITFYGDIPDLFIMNIKLRKLSKLLNTDNIIKYLIYDQEIYIFVTSSNNILWRYTRLIHFEYKIKKIYKIIKY
jgi:hypothetical protein